MKEEKAFYSDLRLPEVIVLMEKYEIENLAEFIESYAHHHVKSKEEMKLVASIKAAHEDR